MKRFLVALPLLVYGGSCAASAETPYRWVKLDDNPEQEALYNGPFQVGTWRHDQGKYYPFVAGSWGPACEPPVQPPIQNFGVVRGHFAGRERVAINGTEVAPEQARRALGAAKGIPDDRGKPFWVVVGSKDQCDSAQRLLDAPPFRAVGRVQCYRPDDAMIRDRDGRLMYTPGVTLVQADGTVLGHTERYDSADDLTEGLRRLDPNYDPQQTSSLKSRAIDSALSAVLPPLLLGGAGVALFLALLAAHATRGKR